MTGQGIFQQICRPDVYNKHVKKNILIRQHYCMVVELFFAKRKFYQYADSSVFLSIQKVFQLIGPSVISCTASLSTFTVQICTCDQATCFKTESSCTNILQNQKSLTAQWLFSWDKTSISLLCIIKYPFGNLYHFPPQSYISLKGNSRK